MRWHAALLLSAGVLLAADAPKAATDQDRIQGKWKITAQVEEGKPSPPARYEKMCLRFTADKMIAVERDEKHEATYKLGPRRTPPAIEITPDDGPSKGEQARGIYQLDGDRLKICLTLEAGKEPPTDFSAPADSGRVLLTLERIKP
jgi:uncharacterized protein (TIGR03067 family)